jgi:hypothetical protein
MEKMGKNILDPQHGKIPCVTVGKNARELAYALQRSKLDCERRLVAQQRDYQACSYHYLIWQNNCINDPL